MSVRKVRKQKDINHNRSYVICPMLGSFISEKKKKRKKEKKKEFSKLQNCYSKWHFKFL